MSDRRRKWLVQPVNPDAPIWRYMSFAKLVDLLSTGELHLTRVDLLGDEFEASLPARAVELERTHFEERGKEFAKFSPLLSDFRRWIRSWVFVSCWHMNDFESDAMWKIYGLGEEGVAVRSTYSRLERVLAVHPEYNLGEVQYLDYESDAFPTGNPLFQFMCKRAAFQHEQEIRVIHDRLKRAFDVKEEWGRSHGVKADTPVDYREFGPCPDPGVRIAVSIPDLIQGIVVSPSSKRWFRDLVESVVRKFGYDFPVGISGMRGEPTF